MSVQYSVYDLLRRLNRAAAVIWWAHWPLVDMCEPFCRLSVLSSMVALAELITLVQPLSSSQSPIVNMAIYIWRPPPPPSVQHIDVPLTLDLDLFGNRIQLLIYCEHWYLTWIDMNRTVETYCHVSLHGMHTLDFHHQMYIIKCLMSPIEFIDLKHR